MIGNFGAGFPEVELIGDGRAVAKVKDKVIVRFEMNGHGLWPVETGAGMRYYSNPLPCACDFVLVRKITPKEAAFKHEARDPARRLAYARK